MRKILLYFILIFLSTDLHSQIKWELIKQGLYKWETTRNVICIDSNNCYIIQDYDAEPGVLHSEDGGNSWIRKTWVDMINVSSVNYCFRIAYPHKGYLFAALEDNWIIKTRDDLKTIEYIKIEDEKRDERDKFFRFLTMKDTLFGIAGSEGALYFTHDGWQSYYRDTNLKKIEYGNYTLSYGASYGNPIYILDSLRYIIKVTLTDLTIPIEELDNNNLDYKLGIAHTYDGGKNWEFIEMSSGRAEFRNIYRFFFQTDKIGWAVGVSGDGKDGKVGTIYKTTDGGKTWQINYETPKGLKLRNSLREIEFINDKCGIVVGTDGLILVTYDGGETWNDESMFEYGDLVKSQIFGVQFISTIGKRIILGTLKDGIYKGTFPAAVSVNDYKSPGFSIFPNPASDFINITIDNETDLLTREVQILDLLGLVVSKSELTDGNNRIDISNLPRGTYFIKVGDKVEKFVKM